MTDISRLPKFQIYCDESSQTKHRYTVIGASFCTPSAAQAISDEAVLAAHAHNPSSEYKWAKVKRGNFPAYHAMMETYFAALNKDLVHYYAIIVDNTTVNNRLYNEGDRDLGFTKFLFTLLFKFARVYRTEKRIYAYLDDRTTRHHPEPMREMLNRRARRELHLSYDPYRLVRFCKSHESMMIQLTDIITGAVAYSMNQHYVATSAAEQKVALMRHIQKLAGVNSLALPTPLKFRGFDLWHLDFKKK